MEITVVKVKVLTLSKGVLKQIEKVCGNKDGKLVGYVVDEEGMATFIGEEAGKLYSTRQDYMIDTFYARGEATTYAELQQRVKELKAKLPQIFI